MKGCFSLKFFIIIAFFAIFLSPQKTALSASGLIINEVMYDAPGADDKHEWIELYNAGSQDIDLTDFKFNDGANHILNPPPQNGGRGSLIIPANGYLILSGNASTTILDLTNYSGSIIDTVMSLNNTSAILKILNKDGAEVASAAYTKEMGASGNGKTLEWDGAAFKESSAEGGTPGKENSILPAPDSLYSPNPPSQPLSNSTSTEITAENPPQPSFNNFSDKIFINEFMPWPLPEQKEWVELINTGAETIDLSHWQIDDEPESSAGQMIPANALIEPGQYRVIELNRNVLNNDGDQLRLLWPDEQTVHTIAFQSAKQGLSSSRFENGLWLWTEDLTPGQKNKKPAPKSAPANQVQTAQPITAQPAPAEQPKINPLSETAQENTAPQKSSQPTGNKIYSSLGPSDSPNLPNSANSPQPASVAQNIQAAAASALQNQTTAKNPSSTNAILSLAAILIVSSAAGLGLIYFRRKKSPQRKEGE